MRRAALILLLLLPTACKHDAPATTQPSAIRITRPPVVIPKVAPPTPSPVPVRFAIRTVTAADLANSWHAGCPVGPSSLRLLTVPFRGFDGAQHTGELVVRATAAATLGRTFVKLFDQGFPIRSMRRVDDFGGDDDRSMAADNTSAFNCRAAVGGNGSWSQHAFGLAVDINPRENPYLYAGKVTPPDGAPFVDRSTTRKGMIANREIGAFAAIGWKWGGSWHSSKDYQHFSSNGR